MTTCAISFNGAFMLLFFVRHEALDRCRRQELLKTVRVSVLEGGREERKKKERKREALVAPFPPQDRPIGN